MNISKLLNIGIRLALPGAIVAMIAFYLIRDIPWDDEAGYHLDGLLMVEGKMGDGFSWGLDGTLDAGEKAPYTLNGLVVFSPLYSAFAGLFDTLLGIKIGTRATWVFGSLCLIVAFAMLLRELGIPKEHRVVALCILSASSISISWVGVSRAGITFVLLAALVALRFPRRYWSGPVVLFLVILGSLCRLEVVLAAPPLILLWARRALQEQSTDSRKTGAVYRWTMLIASLLLIIGTLKYTSEMRTHREWLAFQQHYTVLNQNRLSTDSNPWRDMTLMETDFPGATSVEQAWAANPRRAFEYYLKAGLGALSTSVSAVAPRMKIWFLAWGMIAGMIVTLWLDGTSWRDLTLRAWSIISSTPSGYILAALVLASASSFLVVAEPRHVVGLTVSILLFCALLAQRPARFTRILMTVSVGLWVAGALGLTLYEMKKPQPNSAFIKAAENAAEQAGRPLAVISYDSNLTCMYLGKQCSGYSSLRLADPCTYFDKSGDLIVTLRDQRPQLEQHSQGWQLAADLYNYDLWLRDQTADP